MQQWLARKVLDSQMGDPNEQYAVGDVVQFPTPDGQGPVCRRGTCRWPRVQGVQFDFNHPLAGQPVTL
jgi:FKBP-type peptidyl-prolyl cis-trans isomerase SlpA